MPALMVQGCTSWAGKSWLVTALCRWFADQGVRVAPFKAQNMSNNARVLPGGGEIGVAQWLQARAAGVTPDVRMNPVLVKPEATGSQVVRLGRFDAQLSALEWRQRAAHLWPTARNALDSLLDEYELVVIEGAGSPAEINLADADITNMRVAAHARAPVLLVVDIDRGGAFAHLYGTWKLLGDDDRRRVAGFVLNRFRGDARLLEPGPSQLEDLTGVPTIGTIPMIDHDLPDEDGAALHRMPARGGLPRVVVVRYPTASNLDEYTLLEQVADVRWATEPRHVVDVELLVLPGSKHVAADCVWLRSTGLDLAIARAAAAGTRILGICGGLQLLGRELVARSGIDGTAGGLGLLPVTTTFEPDKRAEPVSTAFAGRLPPAWRSLEGLRITGYEIRHGTSVSDRAPNDDLVEALQDSLGWARGNVLGVYVHGLLENAKVLTALFGAGPSRTLEATFERLARCVETHVDTCVLRSLVR
ncbi:MAG: cobyric acid synthase [Nitriliruptoraceae bacterium]